MNAIAEFKDRLVLLWWKISAVDKRLHFAFCAGVALYAIAALFVYRLFGAPAAIMFIVAGLAVGYELVQKFRHEGEPSWLDALAGIAGGAAITALAVLTGALRVLGLA